jgi:hypothetical protein
VTRQSMIAGAAAFFALASLTGATQASAARPAAPALTLKSASFVAHWRLSKMSGSLVLKGSATAKMQVTVGWFSVAMLAGRTPNFGPTRPMTSSFGVGRGKFKKAISVRGLFPGSFELAGYAKSGNTVISIPGRIVGIGAPPEGVIGRSYATSNPNGKPITRVSTGSKAIFAHYVWATYPSRPVLTQTWTGPSGGWKQTYRAGRGVFVAQVFATGKALPRGTYRHVLRVLGKPIAQVAVRVG